jgi:hypothetical protein
MSSASHPENCHEVVASTTTVERISIRVGQLNFLAQWETDTAPKTCELVRSFLPLRMKIIHCSWSGQGVWIPLKKWEGQWHKENATSHPKPGQLLLHPGGPSEPELLIPCGACVFNSKFGILEGNHFATISDGMDGVAELDRFLLWHGAQDCLIEKICAA